jgi:uncharacterized protein (TIGR03437 family)
MFVPVMKRILPLFVALGSCTLTQAQSGITVAGYGYLNPGNTITAAPGQVLMVSVFGIATRIADPLFPIGPNGLLTEVKGVSADFVQGPITVQLPIRGIQQSPCPASGACSPATTITTQIPYELNPDSGVKAVLRIKEGGAAVAEVGLRAVTDSVHVINNCDQTGIYLSVAAEVAAGTCAPMVMHAHGPLVSASAPARPGETLILWAWGLGALNHPPTEPCCISPDQLPLAVQPFNLNFSYADAGRFPLRRLPSAAPTYAGMVGSGLYQVQFVVPPAPAGISSCTGNSGNFSVLVNGPVSADAAQICLQP